MCVCVCVCVCVRVLILKHNHATRTGCFVAACKMILFYFFVRVSLLGVSHTDCPTHEGQEVLPT